MANIVVYSTTKYLGGHGAALGGAIIDSGNFDWTNGKFPKLVDPIIVTMESHRYKPLVTLPISLEHERFFYGIQALRFLPSIHGCCF